jgi:hypothetical protein
MWVLLRVVLWVIFGVSGRCSRIVLRGVDVQDISGKVSNRKGKK